ncbi:hypothetical protein MMC10_009988 [Thelotrema lepadinum]|nr:hypothetical protein [Thelotrema lepadinum]
MGKVQANIHFLAPNSQYKLERPYILRYSLDGQPHSDGTIPSTNVSFQSYRVVVHDLRSSGPAGLQDYEIDGVAILRFSSALSYEDFQDHNKVRQVYLEELTQHVKIRLGATQVFVIPHLIETEVPGSNARFALYKIRKRHVDFPQSVGKAYQYEQPASVANVDVTYEEALSALSDATDKETASQVLLNSRFEWVKFVPPSVKTFDPLTGFLALGDLFKEDLEVSDLVFEDVCRSTVLVYPRETHKWYYLSGQTCDEHLLFRQTDSAIEVRNRAVPHASFWNPNTVPDEQPRQSIEVKLLVIY